MVMVKLASKTNHLIFSDFKHTNNKIIICENDTFIQIYTLVTFTKTNRQNSLLCDYWFYFNLLHTKCVKFGILNQKL